MGPWDTAGLKGLALRRGGHIIPTKSSQGGRSNTQGVWKVLRNQKKESVDEGGRGLIGPMLLRGRVK